MGERLSDIICLCVSLFLSIMHVRIDIQYYTDNL